MATEGTGTTMSFASSLFSINIISIGEVGETYPVIDTTHLGTEDAKTVMLGTLAEGKPITVTYQWDADNLPPAGEDEEEITITLPDSSTFVFQGVCSEWGMSGATVGELQTGTCVVNPSGKIDITA